MYAVKVKSFKALFRGISSIVVNSDFGELFKDLTFVQKVQKSALEVKFRIIYLTISIYHFFAIKI